MNTGYNPTLMQFEKDIETYIEKSKRIKCMSKNNSELK
jgi:hypothetical protein